MRRLIRTELLKLHTIRATYGLALLVVAHTALFASLEATRSGRKVAPISTAAGLSTVSTATGVTMILAAILGVILASGEYRHTSASLTYLATPRRVPTPVRYHRCGAGGTAGRPERHGLAG